MYWFTSDWHIGSNEVLKFNNRPFKNQTEFIDCIICNLTQRVKQDDTLCYVGDLGSIKNLSAIRQVVKRIKCKTKILIRGNHDFKGSEKLFDEVYDILRIKTLKTNFICCHYPLMTWENMDKGMIDIHGHSHNKKDYNEYMKQHHVLRYDVGIDANDYSPVSAKQIVEYFHKQISRPSVPNNITGC